MISGCMCACVAPRVIPAAKIIQVLNGTHAWLNLDALSQDACSVSSMNVQLFERSTPQFPAAKFTFCSARSTGAHVPPSIDCRAQTYFLSTAGEYFLGANIHIQVHDATSLSFISLHVSLLISLLIYLLIC